MTRLLNLFAVALLSAAGAAAANPISTASVDDFVNRLSAPAPAPAPGGSPFKRFKPTEAPGADHQCAGNPQPPAAAAPGGLKNFVAEYADVTPAQVDMALQFEHNSAKLTPPARALLDTLAQALNRAELASARFAVAGHTDESGELGNNLRLSCARALSARSYLVARGVEATRLWAYGFGPRRLLPGQPPNAEIHRRVEVRRAPN